MRSKKLLRQLKKSLDCEGIESDLDSIRAWLDLRGNEEMPESLRKLVANLGNFLDAVESAYEQAEVIYNQAQRSLVISGQEIEERNRLLRSENQKVSNLLNNMRQAVFSVSSGGKIAGPVSKYSEMVFGCEITEQSVFDVLYCSMDRDSEEYSALISAMNVVFGESDLQWDLSEESLPKRVILQTGSAGNHDDKNGGEKILKVACTPIWSESFLLEKIMFVVEDVTEMEKLERRIMQEKAQGSQTLQIVHELISVNRNDVFEFITKSQRMMMRFKKNMDSQCFEISSLNFLMQVLHTIKGNARLIGFTIISSTVHRIESVIVQIQQQLAQTPEMWGDIKSCLDGPVDQVMSAIGEYQTMVVKLFGDENASPDLTESLLEIDPQLLLNLKKLIAEAKQFPAPDSVEKIAMAVDHLSDVSISKEFEKYTRVVKQMASDLGKEVDFNVSSEICQISREKMPLIKDALIHLIRNAIDHGLETPEERKRAAKSTTGLLKLIFKKTENKVLIWVSDDGGGINPDVITEKAKTKQLKSMEQLEAMTREQVLDLIFLPNFSTRDEVSELSGRGIGMDVVRTNINKLGGTIILETKIGKGTLFKISIPN
jgi:signal transduction histidine kinase